MHVHMVHYGLLPRTDREAPGLLHGQGWLLPHCLPHTPAVLLDSSQRQVGMGVRELWAVYVSWWGVCSACAVLCWWVWVAARAGKQGRHRADLSGPSHTPTRQPSSTTLELCNLQRVLTPNISLLVIAGTNCNV